MNAFNVWSQFCHNASWYFLHLSSHLQHVADNVIPKLVQGIKGTMNNPDSVQHQLSLISSAQEMVSVSVFSFVFCLNCLTCLSFGIWKCQLLFVTCPVLLHVMVFLIASKFLVYFIIGYLSSFWWFSFSNLDWNLVFALAYCIFNRESFEYVEFNVCISDIHLY